MKTSFKSASPGLWEMAAHANRSPIIIAADIALHRHVINLTFSEEALDSILATATPYVESDPDSDSGSESNQAINAPLCMLPENPKLRTLFSCNSPHSSDFGAWRGLALAPTHGPNTNILNMSSFEALHAHFIVLKNTWVSTPDTSTKIVILTNKVAWLGWLIGQLKQSQTQDPLEHLDPSIKAMIEKTLKEPRNFIGHIKNFLHAHFGLFKPVTSWHLYTECLKEINHRSQIAQTIPIP
jgi:hypothetical protein